MASPESADDKIRIRPSDLHEDAIAYIDALVRRSEQSPCSAFRFVAEGTLSEFGSRAGNNQEVISDLNGW